MTNTTAVDRPTHVDDDFLTLVRNTILWKVQQELGKVIRESEIQLSQRLTEISSHLATEITGMIQVEHKDHGIYVGLRKPDCHPESSTPTCGVAREVHNRIVTFRCDKLTGHEGMHRDAAYDQYWSEAKA